MGNRPTIAEVATPRDLRGTSLTTLTLAYEQHRDRLDRALRGILDLPADPALASALDALAIIGAILERMLGARAVTLVDALRYGGDLDVVAAAAGLEADEVLVGTRSWLNRAAELGALTPDELDDMASVLDRAEAAAATDPAVVNADERIDRLGRGEADPADDVDVVLVQLLRRLRGDEQHAEGQS